MSAEEDDDPVYDAEQQELDVTHVGLTERGLELGGFRRRSISHWRDQRQRTVSKWATACFGRNEALSVAQRGMRLVEEAIEAAQAACVPKEKVLAMVEHVYERPAGELHQELGGVGITLLALAQAAQLSADDCEAMELERVLSKPTKYYAERNAAKNAAGFDISNPGLSDAGLDEYRRNLLHGMGNVPLDGVVEDDHGEEK